MHLCNTYHVYESYRYIPTHIDSVIIIFDCAYYDEIDDVHRKLYRLVNMLGDSQLM